jgi:hypothetical protein
MQDYEDSVVKRPSVQSLAIEFEIELVQFVRWQVQLQSVTRQVSRVQSRVK